MEATLVAKDRPGWIRRILIGRDPRWTAVRAVALVAVAFVVFNFVLLPVRVEGPSMLPKYRPNSINFINCLAYFTHEPQRGDVVGIRFAGRHTMLLKRIVGLPGETIAFRGGQIYIDGRLLEEPYLSLPCYWELAEEKIGLNQ
jgi:signal peptidase I